MAPPKHKTVLVGSGGRSIADDAPTLNASALSSFAHRSFISGASQYRGANATSTWPRSYLPGPADALRLVRLVPHPRRGGPIADHVN